MPVSHHTYKPAYKKDPVADAQRHDTLYLPGLYGQWDAWNSSINPIVTTVDIVIQMGNIIGFNDSIVHKEETVGGARGYNSVMVDNIFSSWAQETKWIQLLGPNEIIALSDANNDYIDDNAAQMLREVFFGTPVVKKGKKNRTIEKFERSQDNPLSAIEFHVAYSYNGRLITHGGLTHGEWVSIGKPTQARKAARLLNEKYAQQLWLGDSVRTGVPPNMAANPVFADDVHEVYPSWIYAQEKCPFDQVFAQTLDSQLGKRALHNEFSPLYWLDDSLISYPRFGSVINIKDALFIGLDIHLNKDHVRTVNSAHKMWIESKF